MFSRTNKIGMGLVLAAQLASCSAKRPAHDLTLKKSDRGKRLSFEEVSGTSNKAAKPVATVSASPAKTSVKAAAAAPPPVSPKLLAGCKNLVDTFVGPYKRLRSTLAPTALQADGAGFDQMLATTAADCDDAGKRRAAVESIVAGVNRHSGKIGVILPLTGARAKYATYVVQGMRAALTESNQKWEDVIVLKDSAGQAKLAEQALAELVFRDKVAMVVGGMDKAEADMLAQWSKDLRLPTMLLARERETVADSPYAFRVYPDEKRLAETLVGAATKRGLKRIAIVRPDNHKSDKITDYFKTALAKVGGSVVFDLTFTPDNLDSMMGVGRHLFQIDAQGRRDELQDAYKKARQQALDEGVPFDARMVVLKPIVQFDAVFLPDDFRTVRHFAKLFKFNMVDKLPMIGNHEWRSPALVEPWDNFLDGSIFADFIGSYAKLPAALATETVGSPFFVRPQQVVITDFQLIGYRVGKAAKMTASQTLGKNRMALNKVMAGLTSTSAEPNFFGSGSVFDAERQSNWPTYLFSVAKERLILDVDGNVAAN